MSNRILQVTYSVLFDIIFVVSFSFIEVIIMKPNKKINLRVLPRNRYTTNANNKAQAEIARKVINTKAGKLVDAVQWCEENGKSGYAAWKTGLLPLIKSYKTIDKRLKGIVKTGEEKAYCSILTHEEENCLVNYVKNKNRSLSSILFLERRAVALAHPTTLLKTTRRSKSRAPLFDFLDLKKLNVFLLSRRSEATDMEIGL